MGSLWHSHSFTLFLQKFTTCKFGWSSLISILTISIQNFLRFFSYDNPYWTKSLFSSCLYPRDMNSNVEILEFTTRFKREGHESVPFNILPLHCCTDLRSKSGGRFPAMFSYCKRDCFRSHKNCLIRDKP